MFKTAKCKYEFPLLSLNDKSKIVDDSINWETSIFFLLIEYVNKVSPLSSIVLTNWGFFNKIWYNDCTGKSVLIKNKDFD